MTDATVEVTFEPEPVVEIAAEGLQGPPGPPGAPGVGGEEAIVLLEAHINSTTPHPTYDSGPNLVLLFENGLL